MLIIQILATILAIICLIVAIQKKFNSTMVLFCIGFILILATTILGGGSVMGDGTIGNSFLDIFEYINDRFINTFTSVGLLIMSVMGFVTYMNHLKASNLLALLAVKPLKKLKSPYIVVVCAILLACILKLFIPSHSGLTTLLMATLYPVMIQLGVNKKTAVSAVIMGGAFDLGPACPMTNYVVSLEGVADKTTISEFFVHSQIPVTIPVIIIAVAVFMVICIALEKKETKGANQNETSIQDPRALGIPMWYAIFPVIPLFLVLIFSKLVVGTIVISVVAANFIGFFIAFLCNLLVSKDKKQSFNDTQQFFVGMGNSFASVICMVAGAALFTTGLNRIGEIEMLLNSLSNLSTGGPVAVFAGSALSFITTLATGSSTAGLYTVAAMMPPLAEAAGLSVLQAVEPVILVAGLGRAVAPVSGAVIIACKMGGVEAGDIAKRTMIPACVAFVAGVLLSLILL